MKTLDARRGDRGSIEDLETGRPYPCLYGDFTLDYDPETGQGTLKRLKKSDAYEMWCLHPERFSQAPPLIEAKLNPATGKHEPVYETLEGRFKFTPAKG